MNDAIISVRDVHKWYSGVHALKGISLDFMRNEAVGLVGDNGAGKTTLINILAGAERPDQGAIHIEGKAVALRNPRVSMRHGIETIYQYNSLIPSMSIARNIFIGREPMHFSVGDIGWMNMRLMREKSIQALKDVDMHLRSPDAILSELSGGQRQGVAIARAMYFKSKVMILDEPTNHLSVKETDKVLGFVKGLKSQGVTGIFISHNMQHVFQCCDRVVAMQHGRVVLDKEISKTSINEVHDVL